MNKNPTTKTASAPETRTTIMANPPHAPIIMSPVGCDYYRRQHLTTFRCSVCASQKKLASNLVGRRGLVKCNGSNVGYVEREAATAKATIAGKLISELLDEREELNLLAFGGDGDQTDTPTHEEIEDARTNARLDAKAEYEAAQRAYRDDEITDGPEHQGLCDYETDAERNR